MGLKRKTEKRGMEVQEYDLIARGLRSLDAQDRERWQLGCKNRLTLRTGNIYWALGTKRCKHLEQNGDDDFNPTTVFSDILLLPGGLHSGK